MLLHGTTRLKRTLTIRPGAFQHILHNPMTVSAAPGTPVVSKDFIDFVKEKMAAFKCGAHDWAHVERVSTTAVQIAAKEGGDVRVAYVGALLHDMLDSKLVSPGDDLADLEAGLRTMVELEMKDKTPAWDKEQTNAVFTIVKSVGYKNMIRDDWKPLEMSLEYRAVQDADLLDAIGSIGVARCFAFGGKFASDLFGLEDVENSKPTAQEYAAKSKNRSKGGSGVEHFFEKLLLIKDMMTTQSGTDMALVRHRHMVQFLHSLDVELNGGESVGAAGAAAAAAAAGAAGAAGAGAAAGDAAVAKVESVLGKRLRSL
jgi:uncharacterized protein